MTERAQNLPHAFTISRPVWLGALAAILAVPTLLAWISTRFTSFQGWGSFFGAVLIGAGILAVGWWSIRKEHPPRWLAGLLLSAAVLRLALGAVWYIVLPDGGYQSEAERGGYVMADAFERDQTAWELARSENSLLRAFQSYRKADQYGGLLFFSAFLYRYLGSQVHQPLLMVVITAAFSALAVLFTWAFARRAWGTAAGWLAAVLLAVYPEAVLLGSSQMREAFLVTLVCMAFYGLLRYWQDRSGSDLAWVIAPLFLSLPFSPPITAFLMGLLAVQALIMGGGFLPGRVLRSRRFWLALGVLGMLVIAGIWLSWGQIAPQGISHPLALVNWWLQKSADWQAHLSERASGWIQKIFDSTPDWMNLPLLLVYGVAQPFLPAALIDITSVPVWRAIAIWRAVGWAVLLPFLFYAPLRALRLGRLGDPARISLGLSLVVWAVILLASFRSGGDLWDNPRYRAAFAGLQVALAAWAMADQRREPDPWLRRMLVGGGLVLAWFFPWYLRRYVYLPWPVADPFVTLALGVASALLYWVWDWNRGKRQPVRPKL